MPRKLPAVTKAEAVEKALMTIMESFASAMSTQMVMLSCEETNEDGSPHYCMYNLAVEKGWLVEQGIAVHPLSNEKFKVYEFTLAGSDAFCRQHLMHSFTEGEIVDLINELFRVHPEELRGWKQVIQEHRV